jgi:nicotinamide riboside transporter PnuC
MKAYVVTSGGIFGLLTIAQLLRIAFENRHLATDPAYILITLASAILCIWAWRVLRQSNR